MNNEDLSSVIKALQKESAPSYFHHTNTIELPQPVLDESDWNGCGIPSPTATATQHVHMWTWSLDESVATIVITTDRQPTPIFGAKKIVSHYRLYFELDEVTIIWNETRVISDGKGCGHIEFDRQEDIKNPRRFDELAKLLDSVHVGVSS